MIEREDEARPIKFTHYGISMMDEDNFYCDQSPEIETIGSSNSEGATKRLYDRKGLAFEFEIENLGLMH